MCVGPIVAHKLEKVATGTQEPVLCARNFLGSQVAEEGMARRKVEVVFFGEYQGRDDDNDDAIDEGAGCPRRVHCFILGPLRPCDFC